MCEVLEELTDNVRTDSSDESDFEPNFRRYRRKPCI